MYREQGLYKSTPCSISLFSPSNIKARMEQVRENIAKAVEDGKKRTFRLQCKCFYGTWPQCELSPQDCLDNATRLLPEFEWAVVAKEAHKDGTPHLHGIFYFKEKCNIQNANATLDLICMKHGNYQGAKSPKKVLRYVCKDNNYVTFGDVPTWTETKLTDQVAKMLMDGKSYQEVKEAYPGFTLLHKRKIEDFAGECQRKRACDSLQVWEAPVYTGNDYNVMLIAEWLRTNIRQSRKPRQPQLFISGIPGVGKTRLISQLSTFLRVYHIPREEDFYDFWENGLYDVAVLDEFKAHKRLQWMNNWLDGSVINLRQKGSQILKMQNIPTIILSNFLPEEQYKKDSVARDAFLQRITCSHVVEEFNLFPDLTQ